MFFFKIIYSFLVRRLIAEHRKAGKMTDWAKVRFMPTVGSPAVRGLPDELTSDL